MLDLPPFHSKTKMMGIFMRAGVGTACIQPIQCCMLIHNTDTSHSLPNSMIYSGLCTQPELNNPLLEAFPLLLFQPIHVILCEPEHRNE